MSEIEKDFTLFWRDGKREIVRGTSIAEAMTRAGYGGGALRALDFYSGDKEPQWNWNADGG